MSRDSIDYASHLPLALLLAVAGCATLTLGTWVIARASFDPLARQVVFLGDSTVDNYRLAAGERLEDLAPRELGADWRGSNFAHWGARVGDFFPQVHKAELLVGRPDLVVIGFAPARLIRRAENRRLYDNGTGLRWLPLDHHGYAYFETLSTGYKQIAVTQKLGLLFGFVDGLSSLWDEHVARPNRRAKWLSDDPKKRNAAIARYGKSEDERWKATKLGSYQSVAASDEGKDLAFLAHYLQEKHIPAVVMLMAPAHTGIAPKVFSEQTKAKHRIVHDYATRLCAELGLPVLDFGTPRALEAFPPSDWDDLYHLKSPASYQHMVSELSRWVHAHLSDDCHAKYHASIL